MRWNAAGAMRRWGVAVGAAKPAVAARIPSASASAARRFATATTASAAAPATIPSTSTASPSSPPVALLFPGQGSQRVGGSLRALEAEWPNVVRPVWQELDETLKLNLSRTMKDGLTSELQPTDVAQPAILAHSYALLQVLRSELGVDSLASLCHVTLGPSLGEYTALLAAGSLQFAPAVRLVHARGRAMKSATREGEGGMLALLCDSKARGLHLPSIAQLLQLAQEATKKPAQVANLNSPFQIVLSGHRDALEFVREAVNRPGGAANAAAKSADLSTLTRGIMKAVPLDVSGPFHSSLMSPASEALRAALEATTFTKPSVPVVFNVHAHASVRAERFAEYLQQQLLAPVQWHRSVMHAMVSHGCTRFVELGPSTPLSTMLRSAAARLEKQGRVVDPTIHPVDAARPDAPAPHASILPLMVPKPRVLLRVSSASDVAAEDAEEALAGVAPAWGAVCTAGASTVEEMRALVASHEEMQRAAGAE